MRTAGRTTAMLWAALKHTVLEHRNTVVVAHSWEYAKDLCFQAQCMTEVNWKKVNSDRLEAEDGAYILFVARDDRALKEDWTAHAAHRDAKVLVDHYAWEGRRPW